MKCKNCNLEPMKSDSTYYPIKEYRCLRCGSKCEVDLSLDDPYEDKNIKWFLPNK